MYLEIKTQVRGRETLASKFTTKRSIFEHECAEVKYANATMEKWLCDPKCSWIDYIIIGRKRNIYVEVVQSENNYFKQGMDVPILYEKETIEEPLTVKISGGDIDSITSVKPYTSLFIAQRTKETKIEQSRSIAYMLAKYDIALEILLMLMKKSSIDQSEIFKNISAKQDFETVISMLHKLELIKSEDDALSLDTTGHYVIEKFIKDLLEW